jgi:cephalosporin hydroxylase
MDSLTTIFDKYNSDKNSSFHNYCRQYDNLLRDYRTKPITFLELGVFRGESVKIWRDAFPNAKHIVGVDINPECKSFENPDKSIFIEIGDATDPSFIQYLNNKYGPFDIIIDDASHTNKDVILSFEQLFPLMNDDGLYIVEDTITYKSNAYIDQDYPNHLVYFAKYTPYLNQWRYDSTEGIRDVCVDPFKIQKKATNIFEASIDLITYGVSFIAINKKIRKHWL